MTRPPAAPLPAGGLTNPARPVAFTFEGTTIAAVEGPKVGLSAADALKYLRDNLYFHLGSREQQGLELFRRHAIQLGLVPEPATR